MYYLLAQGNAAIDALPVLGGVLAVLFVAASSIGVWAAMRVGKNTQTLADYKSAAESSSALATSLKAELEEVRAQHITDIESARKARNESEQEIAGLKATVAVLQELATGKTALEHIKELADENAGKISEILDIVRAQSANRS